MRFVVDAGKIIECQQKVIFCIIIVSDYHQAKTVIAMLIPELLSVYNQFTEFHIYIMPIEWKEYGHE